MKGLPLFIYSFSAVFLMLEKLTFEMGFQTVAANLYSFVTG